MMEKTIKFHKPEEELPNYSGKYLVVCGAGGLTDVFYNARLKAFNASHDDTSHAFRVALWAEIPVEIEEYAREYWDEHWNKEEPKTYETV